MKNKYGSFFFLFLVPHFDPATQRPFALRDQVAELCFHPQERFVRVLRTSVGPNGRRATASVEPSGMRKVVCARETLARAERTWGLGLVVVAATSGAAQTAGGVVSAGTRR